MDAGTRRLVLATHNPHKVVEVERILAPLGIEVEPLPAEVELPPEVGETFAENALGKARAAAASTGRPAIGDDSGIEADGARWPARRALGAVRGRERHRRGESGAADRRGASGHRPAIRLRAGVRRARAARSGSSPAPAAGQMSAERRGARGFGYDPVFVPDEYPGGRTMAELTEPEKDAISHRGRAVRALAAWLAP